MKSKFKKVLIVTVLMGLTQTICAQEDHLNTLIKKVAVSSNSEHYFNNIENQMLGRASWKIKCEYRVYDDVKACVMRKGPLSIARIHHEYVVNLGSQHATHSLAKIRVDQGPVQQQLGGFFREGDQLIEQFKKGYFAYTEYKNKENKVIQHQLSLMGFAYAFNDMQEQFNHISNKDY